MFGITFPRALERARHAKPGSAQCIDGWLSVEPSSSQNSSRHAGAPAPAPSRQRPRLRLVWRTHGTPPAWIETAA
jgi:hypothetical protein